MRCDYREYEAPALVDEILVDAWIARADCVGHPTEVELDRTVDSVLEIYEQRPRLGVQQIPRVGLAVE